MTLFRSQWRIITASFLLGLASPGLAQALSEADQASLQQALDRGQRLYAFDQAAWHATDALQADSEALSQLGELSSVLGGWIVREAGPNELEVIFFDQNLENPKSLYVVRLAENGTKLLSSRLAGKDASAIDAVTARMIHARQNAAIAVEGQNLLRCAKAPFNVAVLPPESPSGAIPVYFLSPQTDLDHVPFGGHTRILIDAQGKAGPIHPFTKSCLDMPTARAKDAPKALAATQLLDPVPTEIGVFTMFAAGLPIYIGTLDRRLWAIEASAGRATIRILPVKPN